MEFFEIPTRTTDYVPLSFHYQMKLALQKISCLINSSDEVIRGRGYKALLFPALMLRPVPRGGKEGFKIWEKRFDLFFAEKFQLLFQETYEYKKSNPIILTSAQEILNAIDHAYDADEEQNDEFQNIREQVFKMVSKGFLSKGMQRLLSNKLSPQTQQTFDFLKS